MMETPGKFLLFISFLFLICKLLVCQVIIKTKSGKIKGYQLRSTYKETGENITVTMFLGIPFAAPVVSYTSKFEKPFQVIPWREPIGRKIARYPCYQPPQVSLTKEMYDDFMELHKRREEDCLYLNIWVPPKKNPSKKKSVLFWIPGGDFSSRALFPYSSIYDGDVMAYYGDVIVVATNYRMGYRGFLFSNTTDAPGNVGIWDVIFALRWVNENIEAFGGDKNSITIAGQDSGAVIVSLLAVTPYARGLFKRQIVQSGSAMWKFNPDANYVLDISQKLALKHDCATDERSILKFPADVVRCLRRYHTSYFESFDGSLGPFNIFPMWGDELFPEDPRTALLKGNFLFTDLLIGNTGNEGAYLIYRKNVTLRKNNTMTRSTARSKLQELLNDFEIKDQEIFDEILKKYLPITASDEDIAYDGVGYGERYMDAIGDFYYRCPTIYYAAVSSKSANVYFYDFQYRPSDSKWPESVGATHFDELYYVFGDPIIPLAFNGTYLTEERRLSKKIIKHWSNFIKHGKPKNYWPRFGQTFERHLYINDVEDMLVFEADNHKCRLWYKLIYPNKDPILPDY